MQAKVHRAISKQVGDILASNHNWEILIAASESPDWNSSGIGHHRRNKPMQDIDQIIELISSARQAYLLNQFSDEFQTSIGKAFHYIQDRFIKSTDKSLHARFEFAISRALSGPVFFDKAIPLEGEKEVLSYLRKEVKFMEEPTELLNKAFVVCLSISTAICKNKKGFDMGDTANQLVKTFDNKLNILSGESFQSLYKLNDKLNQICSSTNKKYKSTCKYYLNSMRKNLSLIGKVISIILLREFRYRRKFKRIKKNFAKRIDVLSLQQRKTFSANISNQIQSVVQTVNNLKNLLENGYDNEYWVRLRSPMWYEIQNISNFKSPDDIILSIDKAKEELESINKEWKRYSFNFENKKQVFSETLILPALDTHGIQ